MTTGHVPRYRATFWRLLKFLAPYRITLLVSIGLAFARLRANRGGPQISAALPAWAGALQPVSTIAWPWYVLIGTSITLFTGMLSSLTHGTARAPGTERI